MTSVFFEKSEIKNTGVRLNEQKNVHWLSGANNTPAGPCLSPRNRSLALKLAPVSCAKASATACGRSLAPPLKLRRHADGEGLSDSVSTRRSASIRRRAGTAADAGYWLLVSWLPVAGFSFHLMY